MRRRRARNGGGLVRFFTLLFITLSFKLPRSLCMGSKGRSGLIRMGRTTRPDGVTIHPEVDAAAVAESGVSGRVGEG